MGALKDETVVVLGIALAVLAMAYYAKKKVGDAAAAVGDEVVKLWDAAGDATVKAGDTVIAKPAIAIGDVIGVPRTNETECEKAKREGRTWDASFACPASDFLSYVFN
jgi:hypothetical protein